LRQVFDARGGVIGSIIADGEVAAKWTFRRRRKVHHRGLSISLRIQRRTYRSTCMSVRSIFRVYIDVVVLFAISTEKYSL